MFDLSHYGPDVAAILGDGHRLADLGPGTSNLAMKAKLAAFDPLSDLGPVQDTEMARACHAGLWLYHDFLDESHSISQDIHSTTGSFWHAIMHRREPDAGNSKYWWQRVRSHPVLDQLAREAPSLGYKFTGPSDFVDFCERVRGTGSSEETLAKRVQLLEWQLLFDCCFRAATG